MPPPTDPYRAVPRRRAPRVIETRSIAPSTLLWIWGITTVVLVLLSKRAEIACERAPGGGACVIRAESLLWSSEPRSVSIADVVRARVEEDDGTSRVTLVMKSGEVPFTSSLESTLKDEKTAVVDEVNRFLANPGAERMVAAYGSRWAGHRASWLIITIVLACLAYFTRKIRVIVDYAEGVVSLVRPRFPWGRRTEALELGSVSRAVVEESSDSDGTTYRITLIQTDGTVVPLTSSYDSARKRKARAVDEINAALADRG